jgi:hypothetical protein
MAVALEHESRGPSLFIGREEPLEGRHGCTRLVQPDRADVHHTWAGTTGAGAQDATSEEAAQKL